ncbi:hypothetical protein [Luteimonas sp. A478]
MLKHIAGSGRLLADNFLLFVPVILACIPIAAYLEYGPSRPFYLTAGIATPVIVVLSYLMIRFHLDYAAAARDTAPLLARLKIEGSQVNARVLQVRQSNAFINELPVMQITIQYRYGDRTYTRTIPKAVPHHSLHLISPGDTRSVWIDVRDPGIVVL